MLRDFDADEFINGVKIECGLAFALDTVKKLRQKIALENLDIELYARPFANGRENGLRISVEQYQGYWVPATNQLSPIIWLFCDRHTDYPTCLLTTYDHDDYGLYDLHALKEDSVYLDFKRADEDAANKILDYVHTTIKRFIPPLQGDEYKAAFDEGLQYSQWNADDDGSYSKKDDTFNCKITPKNGRFYGTVTSELWEPYMFYRYHEDVEELKRIIDTHIINAHRYIHQTPAAFPIETKE